MRLSVHSTPESDPEWVVPFTPSMSTECGNSLRTSSAPVYGVAASFVSLISRAFLTLRPSTFTGLSAVAGQYTHGALNHTLPQVSNGARTKVLHWSTRHLFQLVGHWLSVQDTAR